MTRGLLLLLAPWLIAGAPVAPLPGLTPWPAGVRYLEAELKLAAEALEGADCHVALGQSQGRARAQLSCDGRQVEIELDASTPQAPATAALLIRGALLQLAQPPPPIEPEPAVALTALDSDDAAPPQAPAPADDEALEPELAAPPDLNWRLEAGVAYRPDQPVALAVSSSLRLTPQMELLVEGVVDLEERRGRVTTGKARARGGSLRVGAARKLGELAGLGSRISGLAGVGILESSGVMRDVNGSIDENTVVFRPIFGLRSDLYYRVLGGLEVHVAASGLLAPWPLEARPPGSRKLGPGRAWFELLVLAGWRFP